MHPRHEEALRQREQKLADRKLQREFTNNVKKYLDVKFVHFPATEHMRSHGMTVAYHVDRRDILQISTALQHPADDYSKHMGEFIAAKNFSDGAFATLRKPSGTHARDFLRSLFQFDL